MKKDFNFLSAPFPYFGGKSKCAKLVWSLLGDPVNYVEPFAGSAAVLLSRPNVGKVETINDKDGFVANFWRAVSHAPDDVAIHADWPVNENDLFARHSWLVRNRGYVSDGLHSDPEWFDAKIAGWWCWGSCNWIGCGWCSGKGPWIHDGGRMVKSNAGQGINRQLPHLGNAGQGINRQLPHLGNAGKGINRQLPHLGDAGQDRRFFILEWMATLSTRLRDVRVASGDWGRVVTNSVTKRHGVTGLFLDPPYTFGDFDYAAGGTGGDLSSEVRSWCAANGSDDLFKIVLCGHDGEHDELLEYGWVKHRWKAGGGYAQTDAANLRRLSETVWASPNCESLTSKDISDGKLAQIDLKF